jgi:hypothetical protein
MYIGSCLVRKPVSVDSQDYIVPLSFQVSHSHPVSHQADQRVSIVALRSSSLHDDAMADVQKSGVLSG